LPLLCGAVLLQLVLRWSKRRFYHLVVPVSSGLVPDFDDYGCFCSRVSEWWSLSERRWVYDKLLPNNAPTVSSYNKGLVLKELVPGCLKCIGFAINKIYVRSIEVPDISILRGSGVVLLFYYLDGNQNEKSTLKVMPEYKQRSNLLKTFALVISAMVAKCRNDDLNLIVPCLLFHR
jgi:hypothetical protein